uniref:Formylglycine-generating enzyme, required for sulfatase activity, contains SUMF1/FGE domain n=1 Tax=Candidatus Kentrum sp. DK TaxID=2126562 RepID=A0A450SRN7_9GAMM|nr:MAG: Formylglycine-generating enzyme, required for sulfatase activity, contains SUMF1/FGE domain [Candidatus Kentron sp. DK]
MRNSIVIGCVMAAILFTGQITGAMAEPWCFYDDPNLYYAQTGNGANEQQACGKQWADPQTLPKELTLPMPCGRRMLFRRVDLEYSHALDQRRIYMGREAKAIDALRAGSARAAVAGAFSCTDRPDCAAPDNREGATVGALKPRRVYYMGKYEVTAPQYALVTAGAFGTENDSDVCSKVDVAMKENSDRAATNMSWFEAVEFTRLYTEWLLREAPDALPKERHTSGFLRLPTEAEWEYAARGHWASDPARQSEEGYPLSGDDKRSTEKVNFAALWSRSATPRPPRLGAGPANIFGLSDLAGGVAEMTLDLYRYRWLDNLPHGQAGGFIARGLLSTQKARRADVHDRAEIPFYSVNGATRQKTLGFRLMIAAPVEVEGVPQTDWDLMSTRIDALTAPTDSERDMAEEELEAMIQSVQAGNIRTGDLERGLENIKAQLKQSNARLREKAGESLRRRLVGLVLLAMNIDRQGRHAMAILSKYHANRQRIHENKDLSEEEKKKLFEKLAPTFSQHLDLVRNQEEELDIAFQFYLGEISELARNEVTSEAFAAALDEARKHLEKTRIAKTGDFFDTIGKHMRQAHRTRGVISEKWRAEWLYHLDTKRPWRDELLGRDQQPKNQKGEQ